MKIKAVCEVTKLTDRTIRYYIEEELISPKFTENYMGRRTFDFTEQDVKAIQDIAVLRKYGFSIIEIRKMINNPNEISQITRDLEIRKRENVNEETELLERLNQAIHTENKSITDLAEVLSNLVENKPTPTETISTGRKIAKIFAILVKGIIVLLPIFLFIIGALSMLLKYRYRTVQWEYILYSVISLVPSFMMLITSRRMKNKWLKAIILILCVISVPFSFKNSRCVIADYSKTTDTANYLELDRGCWAENSYIFDTLFREANPHFEKNFYVYDGDTLDITTNIASYYYYYHSSLLHSNYDVCVESLIDRKTLDKEIERIRKYFEIEYNFVEVKKGNWNCLVITDKYDFTNPLDELAVYDWYQYYIFAYDEENMRVRYIASEGQDHYEDPPYFMSLEW